MRKLIYILAIFTLFTGCKSIECRYNAKRAVKHQQKSIEHIEKLIAKGCDFNIDSVLKARTISIHRDTIVQVKEKQVYVEVPSDKLVFEQAVRCDSLGRVVLDLERRITRKPKFIKGKVIVKDNIITVECNIDSAEHQIAVRDTTIMQLLSTVETLKEKNVTLKELPKKDKFSWVKGILMWIAIVILLVIVARIVYWKLKL